MNTRSLVVSNARWGRLTVTVTLLLDFVVLITSICRLRPHVATGLRLQDVPCSYQGDCR